MFLISHEQIRALMSEAGVDIVLLKDRLVRRVFRRMESEETGTNRSMVERILNHIKPINSVCMEHFKPRQTYKLCMYDTF